MDMNKQMQAFTGSETSDMFVSFDPVAPDDKIKLYNAINAPETRIADMVNKPICLTDVIMVKCKSTIAADLLSVTQSALS